MQTLSLPLSDPWLRQEVARAQRTLVEQQLALDALDEATGRPIEFYPAHAPFWQFAYALEHLCEGEFWRRYPDGKGNGQRGINLSLLDVGCGVGHYGVLCARYHPEIRYFGTDVSPHMIAEANDLLRAHGVRAVLSVCAWNESPFESFDIVLVSQVLELTDDPPAALQFVLAHAKQHVLLHRLRVRGTPGRVYEPTYCGYPARNYIWDEAELLETVKRYGMVPPVEHWDDSVTLRLIKHA